MCYSCQVFTIRCRVEEPHCEFCLQLNTRISRWNASILCLQSNDNVCYIRCFWLNYSRFGESQLKCFCFEGLSHILSLKFYPSSNPSRVATCFHRSVSSLHYENWMLLSLSRHLPLPSRLSVLFAFPCCTVRSPRESSPYIWLYMCWCNLTTLSVSLQQNEWMSEWWECITCSLCDQRQFPVISVLVSSWGKWWKPWPHLSKSEQDHV